MTTEFEISGTADKIAAAIKEFNAEVVDRWSNTSANVSIADDRADTFVDWCDSWGVECKLH